MALFVDEFPPAACAQINPTTVAQFLHRGFPPQQASRRRHAAAGRRLRVRRRIRCKPIRRRRYGGVGGTCSSHPFHLLREGCRGEVASSMIRRSCFSPFLLSHFLTSTHLTHTPRLPSPSTTICCLQAHSEPARRRHICATRKLPRPLTPASGRVAAWRFAAAWFCVPFPGSVLGCC